MPAKCRTPAVNLEAYRKAIKDQEEQLLRSNAELKKITENNEGLVRQIDKSSKPEAETAPTGKYHPLPL